MKLKILYRIKSFWYVMTDCLSFDSYHVSLAKIIFYRGDIVTDCFLRRFKKSGLLTVAFKYVLLFLELSN